MFDHLGKSSEHRHYDSGNTVFLICHVISREYMFKGYMNLWVEFHHRESLPSHVWYPLV